MKSRIFRDVEDMRFVKNKLLFLALLLIFLVLPLISAYTLKVTEEHPFLVDGKWISAKELKVGDRLITANGKRARITGIKEVASEKEFPVYNLEAGRYHNFVVGPLDLVVHNSGEPELISPDPTANPIVPFRSLNEVFNYNNKQRLDYAEQVFGKLECKRRVSIIKAHNAKTLREKINTLEKGGFNQFHREELIRRGICGGSEQQLPKFEEISPLLQRALQNPERRLTLTEVEQLENELLETNLIEKIYPEEIIKSDCLQYGPTVHIEPGRKPHIVLRGKNPFDVPIRDRPGDGSIPTIVNPGEGFSSHINVDIGGY